MGVKQKLYTFQFKKKKQKQKQTKTNNNKQTRSLNMFRPEIGQFTSGHFLPLSHVVPYIVRQISLLFSFLYNTELHYREREIFYLTTHSTHFIYGYMASDICLRTIPIVKKETRCRYIGYSYRLT